MNELTDAQMLEALVQRLVELDVLHAEATVEERSGVQGVYEWGDWYSATSLIFRHDIARALFGDRGDDYCNECGLISDGSDYDFHMSNCSDRSVIIPYRHYRLQQAVISTNPIRYMYEAVFGGKQ